MNADRKLISQPSVDSENNERVSTGRVGSSPFHAYVPVHALIHASKTVFIVTARRTFSFRTYPFYWLSYAIAESTGRNIRRPLRVNTRFENHVCRSTHQRSRPLRNCILLVRENIQNGVELAGPPKW